MAAATLVLSFRADNRTKLEAARYVRTYVRTTIAMSFVVLIFLFRVFSSSSFCPEAAHEALWDQRMKEEKTATATKVS